jgi:AhpD family alkylhydroperoxidase
MDLFTAIVEDVSNLTYTMIMKTRLNLFLKGKDAAAVLATMGNYLKESSVERPLLELVDFRVSQINQCAYCLDMHSKELRAMGETEQRIYGLSAWRETPFYSERERMALAWAEAVTEAEVSDELYAAAADVFTDLELIDLTMGVVSINTWNRINKAFPNKVGSYKVGMF